MAENISKIQLNGTVYTIGSENSGVTSGEVQTMIDNSLSGYVTTNTRQEITGNKTFIGSYSSSEKPIIFKQATNGSKIGFVCRNTASTNNELATFEFRPNTFTIDGVQHPLMYFGHYRSPGTANAGVPQTVIGFRQYDGKNDAAYHYVLPLPEKAKTPFSLTTSFKDFYMPLGIKVDNSTMVKADSGGVMDISEYIGGGGGLKKWEGTRAEYNALSSYDSDTLYVITDEDVEIPTVPTKVSAFENDAGYLTQHQDLSGYALKSNSEEITFTLEDGSTVTKKFVLG